MDNQKRPFASDTGPEKGVSNKRKIEKDNESKHDFSGLTGFSLAEIIGKGAGKLVFGRSEDRKQVEKWMAETKEENRSDSIEGSEREKSGKNRSSFSIRYISQVKRFGNYCLTLFSEMIRNQNVKNYYL